MIKRKSRNSSIELLRIFSMFAIVMHHYAVKSTLNWDPYYQKYSGALKVNVFLHYFGKLGVVIFVMIGAYFLCEKKFNFKRPINLMVVTAFYSFLIYFILKLWFPQGIWGNDSLIRVLLPFPLPSGYWFVNAYIVMLFAMPFLNIIINNLSRQKLLLLITGLVILWSFLPIGIQIFNSKPDTSVTDFGYTSVTYFFLIYFVSAYIRKYSGKLLDSKKITALCSIICLVLAILLSMMAVNQKIFNGMVAIFDLNSPLALINGVFIFSFFKNIHFENKIINYVAGSMFGVYLFHENSFMRPIIWQRTFSSILYANSWFKYLAFGLLSSLIVFVCATILDILLRRVVFSKVIKKIENYLVKLLSRLVKY